MTEYPLVLNTFEHCAKGTDDYPISARHHIGHGLVIIAKPLNDKWGFSLIDAAEEDEEKLWLTEDQVAYLIKLSALDSITKS